MDRLVRAVHPVTNENAAAFTAAVGNSLLNRLAGGSRALTATDAVVALREDIHRFGKFGEIRVRASERTRRTIWKGDKDQPKHH